MKVKGDAIPPNKMKKDLKECFMQIHLRLVLLNIKVILISGWRWLGERAGRKLINACLNTVRLALIVYLSLFFFGFYSFGWFL